MASDDEIRRKEEKPVLAVAEVAPLVCRCFGVVVEASSVKQLDSYDDVNFLLRAVPSAGLPAEQFVAKIHNGVESTNIPFVEAQIAALQHLHAGGVLCSVGVAALDGQRHDGKGAAEGGPGASISFVELPLKGAAGDGAATTRRHAVRLLRFVPGRLFCDVAQSDEVLAQAGRFCAEVDAIFRGFSHPATKRSLVWDLQCLEMIEAFLSSIGDADRRAMVERVLRDFRAVVLPRAGELRRSVLQNDPNDHNLLYDAGGEPGRFAMLDFGDLVETWAVSQLAIALAYMVIGAISAKDPDPLRRCAALYAGYVAHTPLDEAEKSVLYVLAAGRLATSVTMGAYSIAKDPENEYLKVHAEPGWEALRVVLEAGPEALMARCDAALRKLRSQKT